MMMNNRTFLCVIATLIAVFVIFNVYKMQKKSSEKFSEDVKKVFFIYADWCGHCTRFKPEWAKFKEEIAKSNNMKAFALNVDDESNTEFIEMNKVSSFPTVIVTKGSGEKVKYDGERTAEDLMKFVKAF
jgi:protein disulfide-isomerase/protein disulfide-isomerase A1